MNSRAKSSLNIIADIFRMLNILVSNLPLILGFLVFSAIFFMFWGLCIIEFFKSLYLLLF